MGTGAGGSASWRCPLYPQFPEISPENWEHPTDAGADRALAPLRVIDRPLKATIGRLNEFVVRELRIREKRAVTREDFPRILDLYNSVLATFDVAEPWPLYVAPMGGINAFAAGFDAPFLVLSQEALHLDDELLRVILAHEVAHLMSGHALRWAKVSLVMAQLSWLATPAVATVGGALAASVPSTLVMMVAMRELLRKGELTADRASVLAMGSPAPVVKMLNYVGSLRDKALDERIAAAKEQLNDTQRVAARQRLDRWLHMTDPHPTIRQRVRAVEDWADSPRYAEILAGQYARRGESVPRDPVSLHQRMRWGVKQVSLIGERVSAALAR